MTTAPMVPALPPIPSSQGKTITNGLAASSSSPQLDEIDPFVGKHREKIPEENAEGSIPGYKGFIRGSQHFYGSTYGRMSRKASNHEFGPDMEGNPVDELPNGVTVPTETQMPPPELVEQESARYRLPGYAGYVPGSKFEFASTFGTTTSRLVGDLRAELHEQPKKPRMLATVTTEMLNGTNTVVFDRTPKALQEARSLDILAEAPMMEDGKGNIPGYAGFIRGAQHFYGSTYSNMTRVAKDHDYNTSDQSREKQVIGGIPVRPVHTDRDNINYLPPDRPPGYSGHVPLSKFEYANTFGHTCTDCVDQFNDSVAVAALEKSAKKQAAKDKAALEKMSHK